MSNPVRVLLAMLVAVVLAAGVGRVHGTPPAADTGTTDAVTWPFFAFDNGVGRDKGWTPSRQAELTAQLGYDGVGYSCVEDLDARFSAFEAKGQRIFSFYEGFNLDAHPPVDPRVLENLPRLAGKGADLWIHTHGKATEEEAVVALRELADKAARHGVRVVIYPHVGNFCATGRHALRLAKAVKRDNFGISINVCHELKAGNADDLGDLAKDSIDHLFLVSINGADRVEDPGQESGWSRLIQPLGEGDFDLRPLFGQLRESGYTGPVGLQCYRVEGEIDELLKKSIRAWQDMVAEISGSH